MRRIALPLLIIGLLLNVIVSPSYGLPIVECHTQEGTLLDYLHWVFAVSSCPWIYETCYESYPEYVAGNDHIIAVGFRIEERGEVPNCYCIRMAVALQNDFYGTYIGPNWSGQYCFYETFDWPPPGEYAPYPPYPIIDPPRNMGIPDCPVLAGNPVNLATGNKFQQEADFSVNTPGPELAFRRFYNSQSTYDGPLGYGWTHNYNLFVEDEGDRVIVWDADGKGLYFNKEGGGSFTAEPLVYDMLAQEGGGTGDYVLTRKDNTIYRFDPQGRLLSIKDLNDNQITLTYSGTLLTSVSNNFGRAITFTHDQNNRIETVSDPKGNCYTFTYTGDNLAAMAAPDAVTTEYIYGDPYDPHNMTEKKVAGETVGTWSYDQHDRAIYSGKGGGAEEIFVTYGGEPGTVDALQVTVTDSRAYERTYHFWSLYGVPRVKKIDGSGCSSCPGIMKSYDYDKESFELISITDRNNIKTEFTRDARGNILTKKEASGTTLERTTTYTYHPTFNLVESITVESVANPGQEKVTTFSYDTDGNLTAKTVSGYIGTTQHQYTTAYGYNSAGQLTQVDGPRNDVSDVTTYSYDPATGDLLSMTQPLIGTTSYSNYDQNGSVGTVTDPNGAATTYTYDGRNRVKTVTIQPGDSTTQYFYEPRGEIDYLVLPEGNTVDYTYDSAGRLTRVEDDLGNAMVYAYDTESNKVREEIRDPGEAVNKYLDFEYDGDNRLYKIINPDSTFTEFGYDANGNRTSMKDPRGNTTTYTYDELNRIKVENPPGGPYNSYYYDAHDNMVRVRDGNYNPTDYTYDDFGRVSQTTSPDSGTTAYLYDAAGNLTQRTDANGITVTYAYDATNRLTAISFPDPAQDISYSYDSPSVSNGKGRLTGMSDPTGSYTYHYDPKGNLTREEKLISGINYVTEYTYDRNDALTSVTSPSGRVVTYGLDAVGRVSGVSTTLNGQPKAVVSNATYLPYGGITGLTYGNTIALAQGHDLQYRITSIQAASAMDRTYGHDANGNVTSIADLLDPSRNQGFGYDVGNQITSASGIYGQISYTYDSVGNRTWFTRNGQYDYYMYTYGTNRLIRIIGQTVKNFGYDNNGNITSENSRSYTYNQNNRLIQATENSITLGEYTYNGVGQRIKKVAGSVTTIYHYDRFGNLIAESNAGGSFGVDYLYLNGQILAKIDISPTEALYYYHDDHLGTPQVLTDDQGQVVWKADYKPFGEAEVTVGSVENNLRFPGQYYDQETGLHYNYHRYYHFNIGRYLRADPARSSAGNIAIDEVGHLYIYAYNNPIKYQDPSGLFVKITKCALAINKARKACGEKMDQAYEKYLEFLGWCEDSWNWCIDRHLPPCIIVEEKTPPDPIPTDEQCDFFAKYGFPSDARIACADSPYGRKLAKKFVVATIECIKALAEVYKACAGRIR